jgi:hypothetical protein
MPATTSQRVSIDRFPYDAARRIAADHGLTVISVCHASLPPGTPAKDHYGNYVSAFTVYIGKPGTIEKNCAYARCFKPHTQLVDPGISEALSAIADHLAYWDKFGSRADYEAYYNSPNRLPEYQQQQLRDAWCDHASTAQRAIACLPAELVAWLRGLQGN